MPPEQRNTFTRRRRRFLMQICLMSEVGVLAFWLANVLTDGAHQTLTAIVCACGVAGYAAPPLIARRYGSVQIGLHCFFGVLTVELWLGAILLGGLIAPTAFALIVIPTFAAFYMKRRQALLMLGANVAGVAALVWVYLMDAPHAPGAAPLIMVKAVMMAATMAGLTLGVILLRRQYETVLDKLKRATMRAQAATEAKSVFLATMSHELRTPLNGMIGLTDLVLRSPLDDRQTKNLTMVRECGGALLDIVNDVLDVSQGEAGVMALRPEPVDLAHLARDAMRLVSIEAQRKGLDLAGEFDPRLAPAYLADPVRLRQILFDLLGNAVKYTDTGGVTVRIGRAAEGVRIEVADTGRGVPATHLDSIFDRFSQVDGGSAREHGGAGLGLSIVKQLTELMGGRVGVASAVGAGSRFWVDLPLAAAATEARAAA